MTSKSALQTVAIHILPNISQSKGNHTMEFVQLMHGTIIRIKITCKKIPPYMHDSAFRWFIVKKAKIFWSYAKHFFEFSQVWENLESWMVYANKLLWIAGIYNSRVTKPS